MVFGKSKEDKSQDAQLKVMQQDIANCWAWIQQHEKNMQILIKNNNAFIEKNKKNARARAPNADYKHVYSTYRHINEARQNVSKQTLDESSYFSTSGTMRAKSIGPRSS